MADIQINNLGLIAYDNAMTIMDDIHVRRVQDLANDTILVLEHYPVITKGRRMENVAISREQEILNQGIQIRQTDRGGLLTYHGPGQIVIYFILKLESYFSGISAMVNAIEKTLLEFLRKQGISAVTRPDHPGIWVENLKIASLGLRVTQGVTKHGISLNLSNDLSVYNLFDPCGLSGATMTNFEKITGRKLLLKDMRALEWELVHAFQNQLQDRLIQQKLIA